MKRLGLILIAVALCVSLITSCAPQNEIDEVVDMKFDVSKLETRTLNQSVEVFNSNNIYWMYEATKIDGTRYTTGATNRKTKLVEGTTGTSAKLTLSAGKWEFKLYGYKNSDYSQLAYEGETQANVSGDSTTVSISVKTLQTANGEGKLVVSKDVLNSVKDASIELTISLVLDEGKDQNTQTWVKGKDGYEDVSFNVKSGRHHGTIKVTAKDGTIVYANEGIDFDIYDNLTTTIGGLLNGKTTQVEITTSSEGVSKIKQKVTLSKDGSKLETEASPLEVGNKDAKTTITIPSGSVDDAENVDFSLVVYPAEVASSSEKFTAESGNSVVAGLDITLKSGENEITSFKDKEIQVETFIAKGLSDVKVFYAGVALDSTKYTYDSTSGKLTFITNHLSEYYVVSSSVAVNDENNAFSSIESAFENTSAKGTIVLLSDTSSKSQIKLDNKDLSLNLNGKTLTFTPDVKSNAIVVSNGTLNVLDNDGNFGKIVHLGGDGNSSIINVDKNSDVCIKCGNYEAKKGKGFSVLDMGKLIIDGQNVTVKAQEFALGAYGKCTLNVKGGTFTSFDNAVVGTNGSKGYENYNINIFGGTFNGNIQSDGYIANGIYMANTGTVNVENATFNIIDGIGILVRSGSLNLGENVIINCTKDKLGEGKVGDSKVDLTSPVEICVDRKSNYPGDAPAVLKNESSYSVKFEDGTESEVKTIKGTKTQDELLNALNLSVDYVFITNNLDINSTVYTNQAVVLDLNGKTITNSKDIWDTKANNWGLISVRESGNLTITGNGHLLAKDDDCYGLDVQDGASLTIENGEIKGNIHAIYVEKGQLIVKGGKYYIHQTYPDIQKAYGFVLNCYDGNRKNGTAKIEVKGGMFENFNPANNCAEGEHTNFLAEGYKSTRNGEWYEVSAN